MDFLFIILSVFAIYLFLTQWFLPKVGVPS